jgi:hypothetical protein
VSRAIVASSRQLHSIAPLRSRIDRTLMKKLFFIVFTRLLRDVLHGSFNRGSAF